MFVSFQAFGVLSSVCVALNSVFTSSALGHVGNDKGRLIFYNNVNSCLLFLPLILIFERDIVMQHADLLVSTFFWFMMVIAGVLGYLIGVVTVWQIQVTSPLSHNISGTAKACVQTVLAYMIWKNKPTMGSIVGIILVLGGSMLYAYVRILEDEARDNEKEKDKEKEGYVYKPVNSTASTIGNESEVEMSEISDLETGDNRRDGLP